MDQILHAMVYASRDDPGRYVAEGSEISQIGIGETRDEAVSELVCAIHNALDEHRKDNRIELGGLHSDDFKELIPNLVGREPYRVEHIPGYHIPIKIIDLTDLKRAA